MLYGQDASRTQAQLDKLSCSSSSSSSDNSSKGSVDHSREESDDRSDDGSDDDSSQESFHGHSKKAAEGAAKGSSRGKKLLSVQAQLKKSCPVVEAIQLLASDERLNTANPRLACDLSVLAALVSLV